MSAMSVERGYSHSLTHFLFLLVAPSWSGHQWASVQWLKGGAARCTCYAGGVMFLLVHRAEHILDGGDLKSISVELQS